MHPCNDLQHLTHERADGTYWESIQSNGEMLWQQQIPPGKPTLGQPADILQSVGVNLACETPQAYGNLVNPVPGILLAAVGFVVLQSFFNDNDSDNDAASEPRQQQIKKTPAAVPQSNARAVHMPQEKEPITIDVAASPIPETATAEAAKETPLGDLEGLVGAGIVLLSGGQGAGKSTAAAAIVRRSLELSYQAAVVNHHYQFGDYKPLRVYGSQGNAWDDVETGLHWFLDLVGDRFQQIRQSPPPHQFEPLVLLVEEMGDWFGNLNPKLLDRFTQTCCSRLRKARVNVILVMHDDASNRAAGTAKGYFQALRKQAVRVELFATCDRKPTFTGKIGGQRISIPTTLASYVGSPISFEDLLSGKNEERRPTETADAAIPNAKLLAIFRFLKKQNGAATPRDIQRASLAALKGLKVEQIKALCNQLCEFESCTFDGHVLRL